ncbi:MAG: corrinoid protein [Candidatus Zixiibacteriota bacterium]|nr:MAG: corrinoid protein [candidate division Zixibacteria bacterium]
MDTLEKLKDNLQKGNSEQVSTLTKKAVEEKIEVRAILDDGLIAGMTVVGTKFKEHEIFLPDVLLAAKAMYAGMDILKPLMIKEGIPTVGRVVIGTVHGDLHDIGKNLVGIMLKGAGFEVIDLGRDVPAEKFIKAAVESNANIIGMSALLTTTMPVMKKVIELAKEKGVYDRVKIIVGGAPLSEEYARQIGAHAYCYDGVNAVDRVKEFVKKK